MRRFFPYIILVFLFCLAGRTSAQNYIFAQLNGSPVNTSGWNLFGAAYSGNITGSSEIILTGTANFQSGSIFYSQPVNLAICTQWIVEFDFRMYGGTMADGMAFCFLDVPPTGFVNGSGLGIPATANGLKICFDTYNNCNGQGAMPKLEIRYGTGYDECWSQPTLTNATGTLSFIRSPNYNRARIEYNQGQISVYINNNLYLTGFYNVNFSGYFGFTASTGGSTDNHTIKNVLVYTNMPQAEAGADKIICSGETVSIGTTPDANYQYQWSPQNGLSSTTVANPQLTLVNTGNQPVTYTYYVNTSFANGTGCPVTDSVKIQVMPQPAVSINASAVNICQGSQVNFYAVVSNNLSQPVYAWTVNGVAAGGDAPSFSSADLNNGDAVMCTVTGNCGTASSNVISITVNPPITPTVLLSSDALEICKGETILFTLTTSPLTGSNYQWMKNGLPVGGNVSSYSDPSIMDGDEIKCMVSFSGSGCFTTTSVVSNSLIIDVETPVPVDLGPDKSFCEGGSVELNAGTYSQYLWSTGATSASLVVNASGNYSVIAYTESGCAVYDTVGVNVFPNPLVNLGPPSALCSGTTRMLDAGSFTSYLWNTGAATRTLNVSAPGAYSVNVIDANGCSGSGFTSITHMLPLPVGFLPEDTSICSYGSLELKASGSLHGFVWSTGENSSSISVFQPGTYWLRASDANNCEGLDSIVVHPRNCITGFHAPSAFTPNGDGKNDTYRPLIYGNIKKYDLRIFNRWGNLVFRSSQPFKGWDGTISGNKQASGVFIWTCTYQLNDEPEKTEKGTMLLVR